jgi:hypothetical protein
VDDHLDDRLDAAPLLADEGSRGALEPDLGGGIRAVAELVLEPLDLEAGLRPFDEEAREPRGRLGEHEERIRHRRGAEPLVAVQLPRLAGSLRGRLVGPHVRAPLTLRHRHPAEGAAARQPRDPLVRERRLHEQRRHCGERHRQRATDSRLDLAEQREEGGACYVRAGSRVDPRQRLEAGVEAEPQQRVPGRVELDLVDPLAVAVVRLQARRVLVREPAPFERLAAERCAERGDLVLPGAATLAAHRLDERSILLVEVVRRERRRLVRGA